jgi:hypothetical protein
VPKLVPLLLWCGGVVVARAVVFCSGSRTLGCVAIAAGRGFTAQRSSLVTQQAKAQVSCYVTATALVHLSL